MSTSQRQPPVRAAGQGKGAWLGLLEKGADVLQDTTPLKGFDVYVVGLHLAKDDPDMQMEAHHYCSVVNDDFLQCMIFDGNTPDANLIGVEYMISGDMFEQLPEQEHPYWHPHGYEILSGQLVAPGLPAAAEKAFMEQLLHSYGKTWHTWHTGRHDGQPGHQLPMGDPKLMWSFNRDGEVDPSLDQNREEAMDLDTPATREQRQSLVEKAQPQHGVDDLRDHFPGSTPIPGVTDVRSS